jgi:hypothetical protein
MLHGTKEGKKRSGQQRLRRKSNDNNDKICNTSSKNVVVERCYTLPKEEKTQKKNQQASLRYFDCGTLLE